jgi:hypothetical protein
MAVAPIRRTALPVRAGPDTSESDNPTAIRSYPWTTTSPRTGAMTPKLSEPRELPSRSFPEARNPDTPPCLNASEKKQKSAPLFVATSDCRELTSPGTTHPRPEVASVITER